MRRKCETCEKNRDEKFYTSPKGRICVTCQRKTRSAGTHERRVQTTYGLQPGEYGHLLSVQGGACAICRGGRTYRLNVDHDHSLRGRAAVRGLLCRRCNKLLRDIRDDPVILMAAVAYLREPVARFALDPVTPYGTVLPEA